MNIMELIQLIGSSPSSLLVLLYLIIEGGKAFFKQKNKSKAVEDEKEQRVTQIVFDMLEASREGLATEREEILQLTDLLKRANFEISILERKVATLMNVIDRCIAEDTSAHLKFETAMDDFNKEIDNMRNIKNV